MYQGARCVLFLVMDARERSPWSEAVAGQIRAERAVANMTQAEVAAAAGMPKVTYIRVENGTRVADISQVGRICAALGLSPVELMARAQARLVP